MVTEYSIIRRKIVLDQLEKFPDTPSCTLARMILRDNPLIFRDREDVRTIIRTYRGQHGEMLRREIKLKKYYTHEI